MMLLSLDNLAQRYGVLPSVALANASTLDLTVLDLASKYDVWRNSEEYEQNKGLTVDQMQAMVDRVKNAKKA